MLELIDFLKTLDIFMDISQYFDPTIEKIKDIMQGLMKNYLTEVLEIFKQKLTAGINNEAK